MVRQAQGAVVAAGLAAAAMPEPALAARVEEEDEAFVYSIEGSNISCHTSMHGHDCCTCLCLPVLVSFSTLFFSWSWHWKVYFPC